MIEGHSLDPRHSGSLWIDMSALRYYGDSLEIWAKSIQMPYSQRRYSPLNVGKLKSFKNCRWTMLSNIDDVADMSDHS